MVAIVKKGLCIGSFLKGKNGQFYATQGVPKIFKVLQHDQEADVTLIKYSNSNPG